MILPALYLIPTGLSDAAPADVVPRSVIEIMGEISHFVVENARTARRWIRRCSPSFSFDGVVFTELNTHTPAEEVEGMLEPLRAGQPVGVMSEAGCPAVADPGADIVAAAQREGLRVVPLVGPSSILMGLMGSGFSGQSFCFHGYLPIDAVERRHALQRLERESARERRTQIFIETPYRNNRMLEMMTEVLSPGTLVCVACDITAPTETIVTRTVAGWRGAKHDYSKRPAIFLLFNPSGAPDGLIYSGKGGGRRR